MRVFVIVFLGVVYGQTCAAHAGLIINGSFEDYARDPSTWDVPGVVDLAIPAGSLDIAGWTISTSNVDYVGTGWVASDGSRSIDLNGDPGNGGLAQTFATTPGSAYTVFFDLAGNPDSAFAESPIMDLRVQVDAGLQFADFSFDTTGHSFGDMGWQQRTWSFLATGSSATLEFLSLSPTPRFRGPALDNVQVVSAVPEPTSVVLFGMGALGLLGFRYRRRTIDRNTST